MRGPAIFLVTLLAGAALGAFAARPAPAPAADAEVGANDPFGFASMLAFTPEDHRVVPLERRDVLPPGARACGVAGPCLVDMGQTSRVVPLVEDPDGLFRVDLALEWSAASPGTRRLVAALYACGDACGQQDEPLAQAVGASPLVLSHALEERALRGLTLRVAAEDLAPGPPEARAPHHERLARGRGHVPLRKPLWSMAAHRRAMMLPSHLLATLLLGLAAGRLGRPFTRTQWALAVGFGVVIDVDHLLQMPAYVAMHGTAGLAPAQMLQWGSAWQGFMHTPWALLLVAPLALLFRSVVPFAFWGLHMAQDFVVARHYVPWGGPLEWAIVAALLAAVVGLVWRDHRRHGAGRSLVRHVAVTFGVAK